MNSLLILPDEIITSETALISGSRAGELISLHDLKPGINLKIAVLNAGLGTGEILQSDDNELRIKFELNIQPPPRKNIELIVAISRPQTNKKVLHLAAAFGVDRINLIKSENTEKSYLQSKSLLKENIEKEMYLAIEQSFDCFVPEVTVYNNFSGFREYFQAKTDTADSECILSDTSVITDNKYKTGFNIHIDNTKRVILAVGPESGWSDYDRKAFSEFGFKKHSLGPRIFRTETALSLMLGQLL